MMQCQDRSNRAHPGSGASVRGLFLPPHWMDQGSTWPLDNLGTPLALSARSNVMFHGNQAGHTGQAGARLLVQTLMLAAHSQPVQACLRA